MRGTIASKHFFISLTGVYDSALLLFSEHGSTEYGTPPLGALEDGSQCRRKSALHIQQQGLVSTLEDGEYSVSCRCFSQYLALHN